MGWLFAVALGLHRNSRAVVLGSLVPIALGHALAIATAAAVVLAAGAVIEMTSFRKATGVVLIGWALYHHLYGCRHRVRVGMQTGAAGLVLWSFLMAGAHGAGLMVAPALIPLCLTSGPAAGFASNSVLTSLAAVGLHTTAMLLTTGVVAVVIYEWVGVGFLRRGWINLDMLWVAALLVTGLVLLLT